MEIREFTRPLLAGLLLVGIALPSVTWGAPCVQACKDEIAACVSAECQGLTKRALRRCRRGCKKSLVNDCYADLSVCGATNGSAAELDDVVRRARWSATAFSHDGGGDDPEAGLDDASRRALLAFLDLL